MATSQGLLTKLEKLLISEVSGVDDPANELPGWLVQKAATATPTKAADPAAPTLKDRLGLLFGKEDDVTKEELVAILDERDALAKAAAPAEPVVPVVAPVPAPEPVATATAKAEGDPIPAPAAVVEAPAAPAPAPVAVAALTEADVTKAVETAVEPIVEALSKTLDRLAAVEAHFVTRKSIVGDDSEPVAKNTNTVGAAIAGAFNR